MAAAEPPERALSMRRRRLQFSFLEVIIIGGMLLTLTVGILDALDGNQICKSDVLILAKRQGQQELMAATGK